jgi:hypothetical protein
MYEFGKQISNRSTSQIKIRILHTYHLLRRLFNTNKALRKSFKNKSKDFCFKVINEICIFLLYPSLDPIKMRAKE